MRLSVTLLGLDLFSVEISTDDDTATEGYDDGTDPGDCTTYPLGFTAAHDQPDEIGLPQRGWDE